MSASSESDSDASSESSRHSTLFQLHADATASTMKGDHFKLFNFSTLQVESWNAMAQSARMKVTNNYPLDERQAS
ncbi:hypothetical protein DFH28DRAFT_1127211 [Melampsora americana]|nr:hypothetical protein DFH28DRAFT_1127211 [Melampsora americana]